MPFKNTFCHFKWHIKRQDAHPARISDYSVLNIYSPSPFTHSWTSAPDRNHCFSCETIVLHKGIHGHAAIPHHIACPNWYNQHLVAIVFWFAKSLQDMRLFILPRAPTWYWVSFFDLQFQAERLPSFLIRRSLPFFDLLSFSFYIRIRRRIYHRKGSEPNTQDFSDIR